MPTLLASVVVLLLAAMLAALVDLGRSVRREGSATRATLEGMRKDIRDNTAASRDATVTANLANGYISTIEQTAREMRASSPGSKRPSTLRSVARESYPTLDPDFPGKNQKK